MIYKFRTRLVHLPSLEIDDVYAPPIKPYHRLYVSGVPTCFAVRVPTAPLYLHLHCSTVVGLCVWPIGVFGVYKFLVCPLWASLLPTESPLLRHEIGDPAVPRFCPAIEPLVTPLHLVT